MVVEQCSMCTGFSCMLKLASLFDIVVVAKGFAMALRVEDINLTHRVVGTKHVFTSPDVPGLHVSHSDKQIAYDAIQSALDMFARMEERSIAQASMNDLKREAVAA